MNEINEKNWRVWELLFSKIKPKMMSIKFQVTKEQLSAKQKENKLAEVWGWKSKEKRNEDD